jgi:chemotaxis protein methyltransferase CheR
VRDSDYEFIRTLVYQHSRINLGPNKRELVAARLGKRIRATPYPSIEAYCRSLRAGDPTEEVANIVDAISTNHTYFFRENAHFEFLRTQALPELAARRRAERWPALRLWSAACSSGEEPYTMAIVVAEALPALAPEWPWRIDATDISHRVLNQARAGIYPDETVSRVPGPLARKYFLQGFGPQAGKRRVKPEVQEQVVFSHLNLVDGDLPFAERFQVIFCRNVMIYFDRPTQERLVERLTAQLHPGGFLLVGHSESLTGIRHTLQPVIPAVYRRSDLA